MKGNFIIISQLGKTGWYWIITSDELNPGKGDDLMFEDYYLGADEIGQLLGGN